MTMTTLQTRSVVLLFVLALARTQAFVVQTRGRAGSFKSYLQVSQQHDVIENENSVTYSACRNTFAAAGLALALTLSTALPCLAVSGGGLDFAGSDISGQDFSNSNSYKGKDFTQVLAKNTNFAGSNLQGCRFYRAFLVKANFEGADLRGATLELTSMDDANLKNAVASGAYFDASVIDVANLENADFTDAQFPKKTLALLCDRADVKGTNPTTGEDTRESLMCP